MANPVRIITATIQVAMSWGTSISASSFFFLNQIEVVMFQMAINSVQTFAR